jgi:putative transposase
VPWKVICPMDERMRFITMVKDSEETFVEICKRFGISRKTGYKWVERYEERGVVGLAESKPIARSCPHRTPSDVLDQLLELRKEQPTWGPKKLRARLLALGVQPVPASSTIGDALKKYGLVRPRRRRVCTPMTAMPMAVTTYPNDTWCVDFKGHFTLGDKTRCYPLTVTDHVSRYLLKCEALTKTGFTDVQPHFERAFREFGLPWRIRSDNGPPFATTGIGGLSELSVWWIRLGIAPERIEPGEPQQNGRHERMHRTLQEDTVSPPSMTRVGQQRAFDCFRRTYNHERPHEALEMNRLPPYSCRHAAICRRSPSRRNILTE